MVCAAHYRSLKRDTITTGNVQAMRTAVDGAMKDKTKRERKRRARKKEGRK